MCEGRPVYLFVEEWKCWRRIVVIRLTRVCRARKRVAVLETIAGDAQPLNVCAQEWKKCE